MFNKTLFQLLFILIPFVGFSQNVTVTADKTTMSEASTTTYTATLSAVSSSIVTVNLSLGGTAKNDIDFTTAFTSKVGSTVAGASGSSGTGTDKVHNPYGIHVDSSGNIYVADYSNHRVMKWAPGATSGTVVAGIL